MRPYEKRILENARRLDELEKEYLRLMCEPEALEDKHELGDYIKKMWLIGSEAFDVRNEIVSEYPDIANLQVYDGSVKRILDRIRRDDTFYSISFYQSYSEFLEEKSGRPFNFAVTFQHFLDTKYDEWQDDFYQRFHLVRYYPAIIKIGPIVSASRIPDKARAYFDEIREAYAVELYASCVALCRAMLEMCLYEKLKRKGFFKESKVVKMDPQREDKLYHLIRLAKNEKLLNGRMKDLATEVRRSANQILHPKGRANDDIVTSNKALALVYQTIRVIEYMYS